MNNPQPERHRLYRFYLWLSHPTGLYGLEVVLQQLRDVELLHILSDRTNKQALTIAWAEYGRRHSTASIHFSMAAPAVLEVGVSNVMFGATMGLA